MARDRPAGHARSAPRARGAPRSPWPGDPGVVRHHCLDSGERRIRPSTFRASCRRHAGGSMLLGGRAHSRIPAVDSREMRNILAPSIAFRTYLRLCYGGAWQPRSHPIAPWHNAVLKSEDEIAAAVLQAKALGLPLHRDRAKNWDSLAALDCLLGCVPRTGAILDAGAALYSMILPWLFLYGYRNLTGTATAG